VLEKTGYAIIGTKIDGREFKGIEFSDDVR
jgi:hypothetical protein